MAWLNIVNCEGEKETERKREREMDSETELKIYLYSTYFIQFIDNFLNNSMYSISTEIPIYIYNN